MTARLTARSLLAGTVPLPGRINCRLQPETMLLRGLALALTQCIHGVPIPARLNRKSLIIGPLLVTPRFPAAAPIPYHLWPVGLMLIAALRALATVGLSSAVGTSLNCGYELPVASPESVPFYIADGKESAASDWSDLHYAM